MTVFTLETDNPSETRSGRWIIRVRQIIRLNLKMEWSYNFGWTIRLTLSIFFPSILTHFEDELSVSSVKTAIVHICFVLFFCFCLVSFFHNQTFRKLEKVIFTISYFIKIVDRDRTSHCIGSVFC